MSEGDPMDQRETMDQRRARLTAQIARQRGDLAHAYRDLHKPIELGEKGLQGLGFLRQNAWIFPAVTTTFTVGSTLMSFFGITKAKESKLTTAQRKRLAELEKERLPKGFTGKLFKLAGHGLNAFKVYRKVKRFFP